MKNTIAVSGASGFLGAAMVRRLRADGRSVAAFVRDRHRLHDERGVAACVSSSSPDTWNGVLEQCDAFVHCAARAHVMREDSDDVRAAYRKANVELTLDLARHAARAGVRRFVFVSSLGVNGDGSEDRAYTAGDEPHPHSEYARSKLEAERALAQFARDAVMEIVVVRPPLVYGPDAPGNFGRLVRWVRRGVPLPLGAASRNRRSFVGLDNLVDLLMACIDHPAAAGRTFLVSDGEDLSTADLLRRLARAMDRHACLLPVPPGLLAMAARAAGRSALAQQLLGNLTVDMAQTRDVLGWRPPVAVDEGLRRAVHGGHSS